MNRIYPGDGDPRHGTQNGYGNLRCRCERCREATRIYQAESVRRRAAARPCLFEGCHRGAYAKDLCRFHYNRQLRGLPLDGAPRGLSGVRLLADEVGVDKGQISRLNTAGVIDTEHNPDGVRRAARVAHAAGVSFTAAAKVLRVFQMEIPA